MGMLSKMFEVMKQQLNEELERRKQIMTNSETEDPTQRLIAESKEKRLTDIDTKLEDKEKEIKDAINSLESEIDKIKNSIIEESITDLDDAFRFINDRFGYGTFDKIFTKCEFLNFCLDCKELWGCGKFRNVIDAKRNPWDECKRKCSSLNHPEYEISYESDTGVTPEQEEVCKEYCEDCIFDKSNCRSYNQFPQRLSRLQGELKCNFKIRKG